MRNPSFMLAVLTIATAGFYLYLRISGALPSYGTAGFAVVGLGLLGTAIGRMFMI